MAGWLVGLAALGGCASSPPASSNAVADSGKPNPSIDTPSTPASEPAYLNEGSNDRVIARIALGAGTPQVVTQSQLMKPLIESHGLGTLLLLVQLDLAKQRAADLRVTLSPEEIAAEREATLGKLFEQSDSENDELIEKAEKAKKPDEVARLKKKKQADREDLLVKFLEQQRISPAEMEIVLETNAWLRKMAEPEVRSKITEEMLQERFKRRYNERVRIRHIEVYRVQDAVEAKRRLAAGESFVQVVREMSKNLKSQVLDGELPPFTREDERLPKNFKDAAFALKVGEVSDILQTGESWQIIKLEERIMPTGVKFENVRDTLRKELTEEAVQQAMGYFRQIIGDAIRSSLKIEDPVLERQFREKMEAVTKRADRDRILELERQRANGSATQPAAEHRGTGPAPDFNTGPSPATNPATNPAAPAPAVHPKPAAPAPAAIAPAAVSHVAGATKPAGATTRPAGSPK